MPCSSYSRYHLLQASHWRGKVKNVENLGGTTDSKVLSAISIDMELLEQTLTAESR